MVEDSEGKEWEECERCGQRVSKGYLEQHYDTITCESKRKMKEMRDNGYQRVKHPTLINRLRKEGKTEIAPAKFKTQRRGDHRETYPTLGYWTKEEDLKEARRKTLKNYKDHEKTHKIYENEDYVICNVDKGTLFKKIDERKDEKSLKRKFRVKKTKEVVDGDRDEFPRYEDRKEIYTVDGELFAEEVMDKNEENITDKELKQRYVITGL